MSISKCPLLSMLELAVSILPRMSKCGQESKIETRLRSAGAVGGDILEFELISSYDNQSLLDGDNFVTFLIM